ncbi:hypothetical protein Patl1_14312 [Pistacia atlantica]|uniref:Uncharacterized protein n=1 Tax=Pistacia atlantica TaxID=434234 RepID=A0ACC1AY37_9ROSI|nr:hypothetical protein Patl1_14312 [Pistacia atlantica]
MMLMSSGDPTTRNVAVCCTS